ncbi:chromatin remodeling complex subunit [Apiospora phragmitis]|uniref:Chromatin remodeling complex subunit n=1 Tax=Apiospora phragmitis TaxID=2905665 RepID=A0ABR1VEB7_9PEZI
MDPSLLPTTGPTIHSPSEASYSSGPSRATTRSTSPDTSSHRSSPLLDLHHLVTTSSIVPETNNALVDQQPSKMDKTSVPSADGLNMRRPSSKSNIERTGGPANYQQPQGIRPGAPVGPGNLASRSLTSINWRAQAMADQGMYYNLDPTNPQNQQQQHHFGRPVPVYQQQQQLLTSIPSLYSPSDSMAFPEALLDNCYAYCYDRGNGKYTRLIPADMIPTLCDVPALQQDCLGMIVLPAPRALPANGRSSNVEPVMLKAHIDTITGEGPRTPIRSHGGNNSTSTGGPTAAAPAPNIDHHQQSLPLRALTNIQGPRQPLGSGGGGALGDLNSSMHAPANQHHHAGHGHSGHQAGGGGRVGHSHHHHQPQPQSQSQSQQHQFPQRRPKIYCDKWVHEGVCAFTQQGCKYKHEMPFDKVTQHTLGLFHGLPAWWKKHQAELARQRDPSDGEQDGPSSGPGPGSTGERVSIGIESTRGNDGGGFGGRGAGSDGGGGAAMGGGHVGNNGPGARGNLAWRRSNFGSSEDASHGYGDHPMGSISGQGWHRKQPAEHGPAS